MWPRVAWWIVGIAAVPAAKYLWNKILEPPSYLDEVARINEAKRVREEQAKAEYERFIRRQERMSRNARNAPNSPNKISTVPFITHLHTLYLAALILTRI